MSIHRPITGDPGNASLGGSAMTKVNVAANYDALDDYDDTKYVKSGAASLTNYHANFRLDGSFVAGAHPAMTANIRLARPAAGDMGGGVHAMQITVLVVGSDGSYFTINELAGGSDTPGSGSLHGYYDIPADGVFRDYQFSVASGSFVDAGTYDPNSEPAADIRIKTGDEQTKEIYVSHFSIGDPETSQKTISVSSDAHSAWDQEGDIMVTPGDDLTITLTPAEGYKIADVLVDDVSVGDAAGEDSYELTLLDIDDDHTVVGSAALPVPVVAAGVVVTNANHGLGTVTADSSTAVPGETVRFHIRPAAGQRTSRLFADGEDLSGETDPIAGALYSVGMGAGMPIELDYVIPDTSGADLEVTFDSYVVPGLGTSYDRGFTGGMDLESFAMRSGKQKDRKEREGTGQY